MTVNGSITTTTTYVAGGLEEIVTNGVGTTLTKYFMGASGLPTAERVGTNGPLSYLASDGQGTVSEALDGGGNVTFAQLYTPYGNARYSSGSSPTTLGYTGQRADSATGLDYYQARYYDPVAGQFVSADTVNDGLNRYGYVAGNPTTATDPTGHRLYCGEGGVCGGPGSAPPPPPPDCHTTNTCPTTSGGSGGSKSVSCRIDDNPASSKGAACYDWRNWRDDMSALQKDQVQQERNDAFGWAMGGLGALLFGLFLHLSAVNDPIQMVDIGLTVLEMVADGLGWAASSFPKQADTIYGWLGAVTAFLGVLNAFDAIVHGVAAWLLWTIRGTVMAGLLAAKGPMTVIISLLLGFAGSAAQALGQGAMTVAMTKYQDAAQQENMSVWDWCAGPGKGQCKDEPNGGMPAA